MISVRQLKRMMIVDLFGISSLVLPVGLAKMSGVWGGISIIFGSLLALIFALVIFREGKNKPISSPFIVILWSAFVLVQLLVGGVICTKLATKMINVNLLPKENDIIIALLFIVISWYMVERGIKGKARIGEIIFNYIFIHLIFMLAFSISEFSIKSVFSIYKSENENILMGTYLVFAIFSIISILLYSSNCIKDNRTAKKGLITTYVFSGISLLIIYEILQGIFTNGVIENKEWPVISLMTVANVPGKIFTRVDALMAAIWIISLISLLAYIIFAAVAVIRNVLYECKSWKIYGFVSGIIFIGYLISVFFEGIYEALKLFVLYGGIPIMLLVFMIRGNSNEKN